MKKLLHCDFFACRNCYNYGAKKKARQVIAVNNADIRGAQTDHDGIEQVRRELARLYLSGADYETLRRLTDLC